MRNYEKEYKWRLEKYDLIKAQVDKKLGLQLREKLKRDNKSIAGWIKECIIKYIKNAD